MNFFFLAALARVLAFSEKRNADDQVEGAGVGGVGGVERRRDAPFSVAVTSFAQRLPVD